LDACQCSQGSQVNADNFFREESTKLRRHVQHGAGAALVQTFKKSKLEIEAAIAKVGNNAETVMKELSRGKRVVDPISG
jgi:hypothetical protein